MKRLSNLRVSQLLCFATGILILFACQPLQGQSVATPPKKTAEIIMLEKDIEKGIGLTKEIEASITKIGEQTQLVQSEMESLKKLESKMSVSAESYPEVLKTLHSQRVQLLIDLAGIDARFEAIKKAIARVSSQQDDSLVKQLQKIVEIRELTLKHLKTIGGGTQDAEIALLEAKSRLAQLNSNSGGLRGQLNEQLLDTSLEKAEKAARLDKTNSLIEEVDEYRAHTSKVNKKRRGLQMLSQESRNLKSKLDQEKRQITILNRELERHMSELK